MTLEVRYIIACSKLSYNDVIFKLREIATKK